MNAKLAVVFALFALSACYAQLVTPGKFKPQSVNVPSRKTHVLPPLDNAKLRANEDNKHGGYQFAHVVDYVISFDSWGPASLLESGDRFWTTTIVAEGATSLGVTIADFHIPDGGELYLIGAHKRRGAITANNKPNDHGYLTTFPIEGSFLTLEYFQPALDKTLPSLDIVKVAQGYKDPLCFECSGACNINVACDEGEWKDQIRSVGMLLTAFGGRFCSGSLVNNVEKNGDQLFLTADHCSADSADQVMFLYQSAVCANEEGPTDNIVGGLVELDNDFRSDFALLRITESIPVSWNVFLNGVSGENLVPRSMVGIHHPSGDIKKICFANQAGVPARWDSNEPGDWHWEVPWWDDGTTEPGSSGSPLFDQNKRLIGQLHGGLASCSLIDWDMYGATWASWRLGLGTLLDPRHTGALVFDGVDLNAVRNKTAKAQPAPVLLN